MTKKKVTSVSKSRPSGNSENKAKVIGWLFLKVDGSGGVSAVEIEAANQVEAKEKLGKGRYMLVTHCEVFDVNE